MMIYYLLCLSYRSLIFNQHKLSRLTEIIEATVMFMKVPVKYRLVCTLTTCDYYARWGV